MKLLVSLYDQLEAVDWFSNCGAPSAIGDPSVLFVNHIDDAVLALKSDLWLDVKTEAQGRLTTFLSKNHNTHYAGYWNALAKESRHILESRLRPLLSDALDNMGLPHTVLDAVMLDVNRYVLEASYKSLFPRVPCFFQKVFLVYAAGHVPCGWEGDILKFPEGRLLIY